MSDTLIERLDALFQTGQRPSRELFELAWPTLRARLVASEAVCEAAKVVLCDRFHPCEGMLDLKDRVIAWQELLTSEPGNVKIRKDVESEPGKEGGDGL